MFKETNFSGDHNKNQFTMFPMFAFLLGN